MEYEFKVVHRKGTLKAVADALSRIEAPQARVLRISYSYEAEPLTIEQFVILHNQKKIFRFFVWIRIP